MTASEFEEHWKLKNMAKKADFIHMIQVGADILLALKLYFWHIRVIVIRMLDNS